MKTSELEGRALDWAVGTAENFLSSPRDTDWYCPSSSWAQGGPLIEREHIWWSKNGDATSDQDAWWCLSTRDPVTGEEQGLNAQAEGLGSTLLIAAMRCYVASKLGDKVDIPEELL